MEKTYTIVLRPEPEGGLTVLVPALPEIVSYGEDEKEALAMAKTRSSSAWFTVRSSGRIFRTATQAAVAWLCTP